jgi:lipid-A-disaccharide synthase
VALLPGSRRREVEFHLPVMLEAAARLRSERDVQFICVRASTVDAQDVACMLKKSPFSRMPVVETERYDALNAADLVWTASGTATLETALLLKPMIIVYRLSWLTYFLARLLVKVDHIGIVNLLADERIVPELVQDDLKPERIIEESRILLDNQKVRVGIVEKLTRLRERLGSPGAADRVAEMALSMMH